MKKIEKSKTMSNDTVDAIKIDDLNFDKKISAMKIDVQQLL